MTRINYDPNLTNSGNMAKQTVKLTFAMWEYRAERTVVVGGNCNGLSVIESAVDQVFEELEYKEQGGDCYTRIILTDEVGDTLLCEDDELKYSDWLKDMLIGAEIINIEPDNN